MSTDSSNRNIMDSSNKNRSATNNKPGNTKSTGSTTKKKGKVSAKLMNSSSSNAKMTPDKMGFYNYTEVVPIYTGGQGALETYFNNNIDYPQDAIDNNIEGTVNVKFSIDENGNVANATAVGNKLGYGLDESAVKAVMQMPKWTPGKVKGKSVKAWYTLPITYRLEE